jgi:hypothetical protein
MKNPLVLTLFCFVFPLIGAAVLLLGLGSIRKDNDKPARQ